MNTKLSSTSAVVVALVACVLVGTASGQSNRFNRLSLEHTDYGVSQFSYGNMPNLTGDLSKPAIKLMNPVRVPQAVAAIIYSSQRGSLGGGTSPGVFQGCTVRVLNPHDSVAVTRGEFASGGAPLDLPLYTEYIWSPVSKVRVGPGRIRYGHRGKRGTRLADGLGGSGSEQGGKEGITLAHPSLFSLPSNDTVPGQREAAIDCICQQTWTLGLSRDVFEEFGAMCP